MFIKWLAQIEIDRYDQDKTHFTLNNISQLQKIGRCFEREQDCDVRDGSSVKFNEEDDDNKQQSDQITSKKSERWNIFKCNMHTSLLFYKKAVRLIPTLTVVSFSILN